MDHLQKVNLSLNLLRAAESGTVRGCNHVRYLLEKGADPTYRHPRTSLSARDTAAKHGHPTVLALLGGGADLQTQIRELDQHLDLNLDLINAAEDGSVASCGTVKRLMESGANQHYRHPRTGMSACDTATQHNQQSVMDLLVLRWHRKSGP
jgi:hypothetical protein